MSSYSSWDTCHVLQRVVGWVGGFRLRCHRPRVNPPNHRPRYFSARVLNPVTCVQLNLFSLNMILQLSLPAIAFSNLRTDAVTPELSPRDEDDDIKEHDDTVEYWKNIWRSARSSHGTFPLSLSQISHIMWYVKTLENDLPGPHSPGLHVESNSWA